MSRGQRFTFLAIAALIAVVAIFVLADSSEDDTTPEGEQSAATATPTATPTPPPGTDGEEETATPTPTPEPTPEPPPLLTSARVTELEVDKGDTVRFRVRSSVPEEIHVHGYDITRDIPRNKTVNVSFEAELDGIWEIEFHNSGTQIASLRVNP
jgi:FtsP/CotA-like multicopper oxidase with cupredoxin domain